MNPGTDLPQTKLTAVIILLLMLAVFLFAPILARMFITSLPETGSEIIADQEVGHGNSD